MFKFVRNLFASFFGSTDNVTRVTNQALADKQGAFNRVEAARQAFLNSQRDALTTIKTSESAITGAITAENEAEAAREEQRTAAMLDTVAEGEAQIDALIKALELAQRNAAQAVADLKSAQDEDRAAVAGRIEAAKRALADLKAAEASLAAAQK